MDDVSTVRLRFFASARAAVGHSEIVVPLDMASDIGAALIAVSRANPHIEATLSKCSFLVNGVATTETSFSLSNGDVVDVLPPFAGG